MRTGQRSWSASFPRLCWSSPNFASTIPDRVSDAVVASRTPEGTPNHCPVCDKGACIEPSSFPIKDAPCPHCGHLLRFSDRPTVAKRSTTPKGRIRIYALAKALKIDSKKLVEICNKAGVTGKDSALASLNDEEVSKIKGFLAESPQMYFVTLTPARKPSIIVSR